MSAGALGDGAKPVEGVDISTCGMCEDRSDVDGPCCVICARLTRPVLVGQLLSWL